MNAPTVEFTVKDAWDAVMSVDRELAEEGRLISQRMNDVIGDHGDEIVELDKLHLLNTLQRGVVIRCLDAITAAERAADGLGPIDYGDGGF